MTNAIDDTHDPALPCRVPGAADPESDFPIQNLPLGIFRRAGRDEGFRGGIAIGRSILDLPACLSTGLFEGAAAEAASLCGGPTLNPLLAAGPAPWAALRRSTSLLLRGDRLDPDRHLVPMAEAEMALPAAIGDYTDFFASIDHATNAGRISKIEPPLPPNYRHMPIAYHGRASTVAVSGTPCRRPRGQVFRRGAEAPSFEASRNLDYELELAAFVGPGNALGTPIPLAEAEAHLLGLCLLNDWSARDIQGWETRPLGPFLGKSLLTTISPWIVTLEALAPFRIPARPRGAEEPPLLPYLDDPADRARGGFAITVEVWLQSQAMRDQGMAPIRLGRSAFAHMYWTIFQMLTQHTSNGCAMRPGDLIASGTISGPEPEARGCMLELSDGGRKATALPSGETRRFLEDGDAVIFRAWAERPGYRRIGFGECRGVVAPA